MLTPNLLPSLRRERDTDTFTGISAAYRLSVGRFTPACAATPARKCKNAGGCSGSLVWSSHRDNRSDDPSHGLTTRQCAVFICCPHVARLLGYCPAPPSSPANAHYRRATTTASQPPVRHRQDFTSGPLDSRPHDHKPPFTFLCASERGISPRPESLFAVLIPGSLSGCRPSSAVVFPE